MDPPAADSFSSLALVDRWEGDGSDVRPRRERFRTPRLRDGFGPAARRREVEPIGIGGKDEIGTLARAFDDIQQTAVRTAVDLSALLRRGIGDLFVNLARRRFRLGGSPRRRAGAAVAGADAGSCRRGRRRPACRCRPPRACGGAAARRGAVPQGRPPRAWTPRPPAAVVVGSAPCAPARRAPGGGPGRCAAGSEATADAPDAQLSVQRPGLERPGTERHACTAVWTWSP